MHVANLFPHFQLPQAATAKVDYSHSVFDREYGELNGSVKFPNLCNLCPLPPVNPHGPTLMSTLIEMVMWKEILQMWPLQSFEEEWHHLTLAINQACPLTRQALHGRLLKGLLQVLTS